MCPEKGAPPFQRSDLAMQDRIFEIRSKKRQNMPYEKIRSCNARSNLQIRSARLLWVENPSKLGDDRDRDVRDSRDPFSAKTPFCDGLFLVLFPMSLTASSQARSQNQEARPVIATTHIWKIAACQSTQALHLVSLESWERLGPLQDRKTQQP